MTVAEAPEGAAPSVPPPNPAEEAPPNNTRMFVYKDSAGLRVRAFPSLQSEQVGLIPTGCAITFDDVVCTSAVAVLSVVACLCFSLVFCKFLINLDFLFSDL